MNAIPTEMAPQTVDALSLEPNSRGVLDAASNYAGSDVNNEADQPPDSASLLLDSYRKYVNRLRVVYGPPVWWKYSVPRRGSDVCVSTLPETFPHEELLQFLACGGTVYKLKILHCPRGRYIGVYVRYSSPKVAAHAVKKLNAMPIRPGYYMRLQISSEVRRVYIDNIADGFDMNSVITKMKNEYCHFKSSMIHQLSGRRHHVYVFQFINRKIAAAALENLQTYYRHSFRADWFECEEFIGGNPLNPGKVLFLKDLPSVPNLRLCQLLGIELEGLAVKEVDYRIDSGEALIFFHNREHAEYAIRFLKPWYVYDNQIEVQWADSLILGRMKRCWDIEFNGVVSDVFTRM